MLAALVSHLTPAVRPHPTSADQKQLLEAKAHPPSAHGEGGEGGEAALEPLYTTVPRFGLDDFAAARGYLQAEGYVILAS